MGKLKEENSPQGPKKCGFNVFNLFNEFAFTAQSQSETQEDAGLVRWDLFVSLSGPIFCRMLLLFLYLRSAFLLSNCAEKTGVRNPRKKLLTSRLFRQTQTLWTFLPWVLQIPDLKKRASIQIWRPNYFSSFGDKSAGKSNTGSSTSYR